MHLSITLSTFPALVLIVLLYHLSKGQLIPVVMFLSIFQAASVVNISVGGQTIDITPSYLVVFATLFRGLIRKRVPMRAIWQSDMFAVRILTLFGAYAVLSAMAFPVLFEGVPISNPRLGADVPLHWNMSNMTQLFYLLCSLSFFAVASFKTSNAELATSVRWFVSGAFTAAVLLIYQWVGFRTGIPFPRTFFSTSTTYSLYDAYDIDGFTRVNGTFPEASTAAFTMAIGLSLVLWRLLSGRITVANIAIAVTMITGLVLTLSTTGYLCFGYLLLVSSAVYLARWKGGAGARALKLLLALPMLVICLAVLVSTETRIALTKRVESVVLSKTDSASYRDRTRLDEKALSVATSTWLLGAGWGSCRASSFVASALGNVGIPGVLLFSVFCWTVLKPVTRINHLRVPLHGGVLIALGSALLSLLISVPEANHPVMWLLFAIAAKLNQKAGRPRPTYECKVGLDDKPASFACV